LALCFAPAEPRRQVGLLLEGLIGGVERKNGWQLAEYAGDAAPWRMQALLGQTLWDQEKARHHCRDFVIERLGDPSGVFKALSDDPDFEYAMIDGTIVQVHQMAPALKGGLKIRQSAIARWSDDQNRRACRCARQHVDAVAPP
jgi:hypothetical protein